MAKYDYDIIIIGSGSGGLTIGLFMNQVGLNVLMISKSDLDIGGDCLNDGCVPSKALINIAKIIHKAQEAAVFGLQVTGKADIKKAVNYIQEKQSVIRKHENGQWLKDQGIDLALGNASFSGINEVTVNDTVFTGRKIIIATGSKPRLLEISGAEMIRYFDNESIFKLDNLPDKILVVGAGPIGIEIAQALSRLGSSVTVISQGSKILEHDDQATTAILEEQLEKEGIKFFLNSCLDKFISATEAILVNKSGENRTINFDAVFVAIGRELDLESLLLHKAGIEVEANKIVIDNHLKTTNKNVFVCGDVASSLQFSHAAEFHGRILLNNLFSPFKKKLTNDHMSWVTFTDPELATFGLNEKQLIARNINYQRLEKDFKDDDRAVVDNYQYGKLVLFVSKGGMFRKKEILGGSMVAPSAGELVQELILANSTHLSVNAIFNKIYPYPVASRINQSLITDLMTKSLTPALKKLLRKAYQIFS